MKPGLFFKLLLMCLPMMWPAVCSAACCRWCFPTARRRTAWPTSPCRRTSGTLFFLVIVGPIFEEWLFRKQLIDHTRKYGEKTAILLSGLAFGLFHMNLFQFFYAFLLGLMFGYVYTRTSSCAIRRRCT